jgi:hypothetical protein
MATEVDKAAEAALEIGKVGTVLLVGNFVKIVENSE